MSNYDVFDALDKRICGLTDYLLLMGTGLHRGDIEIHGHPDMIDNYESDAVEILQEHPHLMPLDQRELFFEMFGGGQ